MKDDLMDLRYENTLNAIDKLGSTFGAALTLFTEKVGEQFSEVKSEIGGLKEEIVVISNKFDGMPLQSADIDKITKAKNNRIVTLLGGKDSNAYRNAKDGKGKNLRSRAYSDINVQIQREYGVSSYKFIRSNQTDMVLKFISEYDLPYELKEAVRNANNQESLF